MSEKDLSGIRREGQKRAVASRNNRDMKFYSSDYRVEFSKWVLNKLQEKAFTYSTITKTVGVHVDTLKVRLISGKLKDHDINKIKEFLNYPK